MARPITFSRVFRSYHPKAGQPTHFAEKIHWGITNVIFEKWPHASKMIEDLNKHLPSDIVQNYIDSLEDDFVFSDIIKHHTIREGHRWKAGDWFKPVVWSGKPYASKQIQFAPEIQIPKEWSFELKYVRVNGDLNLYAFINGNLVETPTAEKLAVNDGLSLQDFTDWFVRKGQKFIVNYPIFDGQIICWNENINY